FALVAGAKPSVAQRLGRLLGPIPVSGENVLPSYHYLIIISEPHLDARNRRAYAPDLNLIGIIHGANRCGLSEAVNLQDADAQHHEVELRLSRQRCRAADQRLEISSNHFSADRGKDQPVGHSQPHRIPSFRSILMLARPRAFGARVDRLCYSARLPELFIDSSP